MGSSSLGCVVCWPEVRPPLAQILPLFDHLGLVLVDHRPKEKTDTFVFAPIEDGAVHQVPGLLSDAFTAALPGGVERVHLLGRLATSEEVADAVLFLASSKSTYNTGAVLPVDGGYTAF